jgi:hypothetical protein
VSTLPQAIEALADQGFAKITIVQKRHELIVQWLKDRMEEAETKVLLRSIVGDSDEYSIAWTQTAESYRSLLSLIQDGDTKLAAAQLLDHPWKV